VLTRREFLRSTGALGALGALGAGATVLTACAAGQHTWEAPETIDNTGTDNVSAALTDWLATTGGPGDVFTLRRRADDRPGRYWVPQGVRIGKPMTFDMVGCHLLTGRTLGADDARIEENRITFPPLWDDGGEQSDPGAWPCRRVVLLISASNVTVNSSRSGARIQGAARTVHYRGDETVVGRQVPTGCVYDATLATQHGIRIGGRAGAYSDDHAYSNIVLDLNDISVEFVHGDGVYLNDNHRSIQLLGRNLGEPVLGGTPAAVDDACIVGYSGQGGTIVEGATRDLDRWVPDAVPLPGIHHTGRHGIATDLRNYDLLVDGVAIWRTARAIIDFEPTSDGAEIVRPTVRNIETGIHTLNWIAAAGPRSIRDLVIQNTVNYEQIQLDTRNADATHRHSNWWVQNNRTVSGVKARTGAIFNLDRIDGLLVLDNYSLVKGAGRGIDEGTSTNLWIAPDETIQFPYAS